MGCRPAKKKRLRPSIGTIENRPVTDLRLFSYKMTHDTGFAPNPFHGWLTLATCKPGMRRTKQAEDWIAGFTSVELNGDAVGSERMVYAMRVAEKISFADFFRDQRFANKIPDQRSPEQRDQCGDNIYRPLVDGAVDVEHFAQMPNDSHQDPCHGGVHAREDLSGSFVLIAREFYYFGRRALALPACVRPTVPFGPAINGWETHEPAQAERFVSFLRNRYRQGIHAAPHGWNAGDTSWELDSRVAHSAAM